MILVWLDPDPNGNYWIHNTERSPVDFAINTHLRYFRKFIKVLDVLNIVESLDTLEYRLILYMLSKIDNYYYIDR